ncbi:MAG TPA: hypothetical protein VFI47_21450 [Acidimicrobiales bacterium]|nr:hypothetical protein [Acidimicrobiales bacterium]
MTAAPPPLPGKSIASLLGAQPAAPGPAQRLSESPLWDRQRRFYAREASGIWGTAMVPHSITCNPRIANTYARLVLEFLRAAKAEPGHGPPGEAEVPHIVEFGGGTGRFAYLFVRDLQKLAPGLRFTYVLTDFSAERVASWADHASYRPLVEDGLIDFAVLDADHPGPLELVVSGRRLTPGSLRAPVVGIANYVFDTLRQDGFAIRGGETLEARLVLPDERDGEPDGEPGTAMAWETVPCGPVPDDLAPILDLYRETLDDTAVLVPEGGLRCLEYLADLTTATTCAFVADKGHCTPVELCSHEAPSMVFHGSGFSVMVNFDFLARWVRRRGGLAILPLEPARSLVVAAFVQGDLDDPARFESWVQDQLLDIGPDNYFTIRPLLTTAGTPSIETVLASLRLSRHDPTLLIEFLPDLLELLPTVPDSMTREIERVLVRVWDNYFPIGEPIDMALCVGLAFSAMARFHEAVEFLEMSVKEHPDSAPAAFAMALARRGLRDLRAAQEWVARALELEPAFSEARSLRAVLTEELGSEAVL